MIFELFSNLLNLYKINIFCIYKLKKIIMIYKNKNLIFIIFKLYYQVLKTFTMANSLPLEVLYLVFTKIIFLKKEKTKY